MGSQTLSPACAPAVTAAVAAALRVCSVRNLSSSTKGGKRRKKGSRRKRPEPKPSFSAAVVGRPNVGKSTLFNRLVGRKAAIVDASPNVTRDRQEGVATLAGLDFRLFDTAGLETVDALPSSVSPESIVRNKEVQDQILAQTERAVGSADTVLFMIDARAGVTPWDRHFASWIRENMGEAFVNDGRVLLVINKCEGKFYPPPDDVLDDAAALGFGPPVAISAEHAEGMVDLFEALLPFESIHGFPEDDEPFDPDDTVGGTGRAGHDDHDGEDRAIKVAVVGRPNAGKSSLINSLLADERVVVGPVPGITRDPISVDTAIEVADDDDPTGAVRQRIELVDTAGLLKSQRAPPSFATEHAHVDVQSFMRTRQTVKRAQVVVLVVDTTVPHADDRDELVRSLVHGKDPLLRKEDAAIVRLVAEEGRALVVALNKWDTLGADGQSKALLSSLEVEPWDPGDVSPRAPRFAAPSTAKGLFQIILKQINDIMPPQMRDPLTVPICALPATEWTKLDPSAVLWPVILHAHDLWSHRVPTAELNAWLKAMTAHRRPPGKVKYITQVSARPPCFVLFVGGRRAGDDVWSHYTRYLTNELRKEFGFMGIPLRLRVKRSEPGRNPFASS